MGSRWVQCWDLSRGRWGSRVLGFWENLLHNARADLLGLTRVGGGHRVPPRLNDPWRSPFLHPTGVTGQPVLLLGEQAPGVWDGVAKGIGREASSRGPMECCGRWHVLGPGDTPHPLTLAAHCDLLVSCAGIGFRIL